MYKALGSWVSVLVFICFTEGCFLIKNPSSKITRPQEKNKGPTIQVKHSYNLGMSSSELGIGFSDWPVEDFAISLKQNLIVFGTIKRQVAPESEEDKKNREAIRVFFFPLESKKMEIDSLGETEIEWNEEALPQLAVYDPKTACLIGETNSYLLRPFEKPKKISSRSLEINDCKNDQGGLSPKPFVFDMQGERGELKGFYEQVEPPGMKMGVPYTVGHYLFNERLAILFRAVWSDHESGGLWEAHLVDRKVKKDVGHATFPGIFPGVPLAQGKNWVLFGTHPIYMTSFGGILTMIQIQNRITSNDFKK